MEKNSLRQFILFGGITLIMLGILYCVFFYTNFNALLALGLMIAVLFIVFFKIQERRNNNLKLSGTKIVGKIQRVSLYISNQIAVGQRDFSNYEFRLHCLGLNTNTNKDQEYISDIMHFQPVLDLPADENINVFVDPKNPEQYLVDISQIKVAKPPYLKGGSYESLDGKNYSEIA